MRHIKVILGDCMEVMKQYPEKYFDLAVVDPPYNISSQQKRGVGSRIDKSGKMNNWNNLPPNIEYFDNLFNVSSEQIIWGANNYEGLPRTEYFAIWDKKQTVDNFASAEYAWVSMGIGKPAKIFEYGIHKHNSDIDRIHPTQKPVALYDWIYKNYLPEGGKVLDTHGGSMSNVISWIKAGNIDGVCVEIDADYFKDAKKRIQNFLAQQDMFRNPVTVEFIEP